VPVVEQYAILGLAAGMTNRIGLGTFVTNVMNRHPAVVARMASTLQEGSGGRFTLGIGVGGAPPEHRAYGIPFPEVAERADRLEEAVQVIRALWAGGPVTRPSPVYPLEAAHGFPVPDPAPRILIGASSPRGVRIAASLGDGWAAEIEEFEALMPAYEAALADAGRERAATWIALGFGGASKSGQDALVDSPWIDAPRETWARYAALGVNEAIVTARTTGDVDRLVAAVDRW